MVEYAGDITRFGPGFVSALVLRKGIKRFIESFGPFDVLFMGPNVPITQDTSQLHSSVAYHSRYSAWSGDSKTNLNFLKDLFKELSSIQIPVKVVSLLNLDYYGVTSRQIDNLMQLNLHILAPDSGFVHRWENIPTNLLREKHFLRKRLNLSDSWLDFLSSNSDRVISGLHFIAEDEFVFRELAGRENLVSVPGAEYVMRRHALKLLRNRGVRTRSKIVFNAYRLMNKLRIPVYSNYILQKMFNVSYRGSLGDTKFIYAARGVFGIPVRKFLEIPASGALLVCAPPIGFDNMGFINGWNYIECDPESLPDVIVALESDIENAQSIARRAQKLVFEEHSVQARGRQLRRCLELILTGRYRSSSWRSGQFVVEQEICAE